MEINKLQRVQPYTLFEVCKSEVTCAFRVPCLPYFPSYNRQTTADMRFHTPAGTPQTYFLTQHLYSSSSTL